MNQNGFSPSTLTSGGTYSGRTSANNITRNVRFDGIRDCIQPVLDFTGLFTNCLQWTGVAGGVLSAWAGSKGTLVAKIVARSTAYLRHDVSVERVCFGERRDKEVVSERERK